MEEKNWLKELVESSDFEYFDDENDENYENYEDLEDEEYAIGRSRGKGKAKRTTAGRVLTTKRTTAGRVPSGEQKNVPLQASPNPFTQQQPYNAVSSLNFDLVVKTTVNEQSAGVYPQDATYEVPILYPFANKEQSYGNTLSNYGLLTKGAAVQYAEGSSFRLNNTPWTHAIVINGMSFNLSDLYNAILYRNLKLQINKIRFALQEPNDVAYLNTLTMYSIGITSKIQKDSLNVGSFVQPQNFNTNIVDVDMKIILDYNSILTYMINTAMVDKPASGSAVNTFRMSFFCNILK